MRPPKRENIEYEKLKTDDFLKGVIESIDYDMEHKFKHKGEEKIRPAVRFKFMFEGYSFPHYSRWGTFTYGEKSNLYLKYLINLVEGAEPDMEFELDLLKGMKIKALWSEKNDFQSLETIRPLGKKIQSGEPVIGAQSEAPAETIENEDKDGEVPF